MQKHAILLLVGALILIAGGSLVVPILLEDETTPILRWDERDEQEVPEEPADAEVAVDEAGEPLARTAIEVPAAGSGEDRVEVVLRGRVVDKFQAAVPAATVWLDFGRGGQRGGGPANRQRRVPDPVTTDAEGRFAFQGQAFRNLRVWLQVAHERHALGLFDKDVGSVATEVDLGDLVLMAGGEVRGRVTDLDGNGIPGAELRLQPENGNTLRQLRDRDKLLPPFQTDTNGFFRRPHLAAGDWSVAATAKRHTEGRSPTFVVEEDQVVDLEDIRLGPGFEVTGIVRDVRGEPIAKAAVVMQNEGRGRPAGAAGPGGRGGPGAMFAPGGGREHRTTTDAAGRFLLEHLPGVAMRLQVDAEGFLDYRQDGVDPTLGQVLQVAMQDGLRIEGRVQEQDGAPVTQFAFRAVRLRGLPLPGQGNVDFNALMTQMRDGNLDEATRAQLRAQMEGLREQFGRQDAGRGGRGQGGQGGADGPDAGRPNGRDLGKVESHPDGRFTATGLQEGVYEVHVQSPEHARQRSAELELRHGQTPPPLTVVLDAGVYVAGVVLDATGDPIVGAQVELRAPSAFEGLGRRGRPGRDGNAAPGTPAVDANGLAREASRLAAGAQLNLETKTDRDGVFILKHVPRGTWRLQAEASGHARGSIDALELTADRSGLELRLATLGSIAGTVRGLRADEVAEARVAAVPFPSNTGGGGQFGGLGAMMGRGRGGPGGGGGPFQNVAVDANGAYRITDLAPGEYLVRSWIGSPQELMRELAPRFADGSLRPDVAVRASEVTKFDLEVTRPQVGTVAGTVLHNQAPGTGLQVELTRQDEAGGNQANGGGRGGRGPGGFGGFGRTFQTVVASSGRFSLANVPPGTYRLRVQNTRRGGTLHEELLQVVADVTTERAIVIQTHTLRGTLTRDDGGNPTELNGRVSLLPGLTELPSNLGAWQRENPGFDARLQNGAFQFESLKPGGYLLVCTVRGRERTSLPIVVQGDLTITVPAGKAAAAAPPTAPQPTGR